MDNPLAKRFREFISTSSNSRTIAALAILIIAAAVPLTVLVAQQRQNTQEHASVCYHPCGSQCTSCYGSPTCGSTQHLVCYGCAPTCVNNSPTPAPTASPATTAAPSATPTSTSTTQATSTSSPSPYTCQLTAGQSCLAGSCGTYGSGSGTCPGGYVCCKYSGAPSCVAPNYMICGPDCYNVSSCKCGTTTGAAAATCVGGGAECLSSLGECPSGTTATATPTTQSQTNPSSSPTSAPSSSPIAALSSTPLAGTVQAYCGVGAPPPGSTSGNQINVSTAYFTWNRPTNPSDYVELTYSSPGGGGSYLVGTSNSFYAPRPAGSTFPVYPSGTWNYIQCTASNQTGTGYSCGFVNGEQVTWYLKDTVTGATSPTYTFTAATCPPPVSSAPSCGTLTANPSTVNINGTSNLSISCQNTTSYTWSSSCGSVNNVNSSSTTWTAPSNGPTTCTVTVKATNSSGSTQASTSINVTVPTCNGSSAGVGVADCSQAVCQANQVNACGAASGTETCVYNTYNVNSSSCNPVNVPNQSCSASCANGVACYNGLCQNASPAPSGSPSPTPTPAPGDTVLALNVGMDAIGSVGDNENPNPSSSNKNPVHPQRNVEVWVFDSNNNQVADKLGSINYASGSGIFTGTLDVGAIATGNYTIKIKSPGHLRKLVSGIQNLGPNLAQPIQLPQANLVAGDINGDNAINITDYNILLSCIDDPTIANVDNHQLCNSNPNYIIWSDLDDNGVVNRYDYNLFLREYSVQNGE